MSLFHSCLFHSFMFHSCLLHSQCFVIRVSRISFPLFCVCVCLPHTQGGAYNSGRENVTNSFWSGFWYLDQVRCPDQGNCSNSTKQDQNIYISSSIRHMLFTKCCSTTLISLLLLFSAFVSAPFDPRRPQLASFARTGHGAYCRQTLMGGHYGLLGMCVCGSYGVNHACAQNNIWRIWIYHDIFLWVGVGCV